MFVVFQQWHCHSCCSFDVTKSVLDDIVVGNNGRGDGDAANNGSDDDDGDDDVDNNSAELISVDNVADIFIFISFDITTNEP